MATAGCVHPSTGALDPKMPAPAPTLAPAPADANTLASGSAPSEPSHATAAAAANAHEVAGAPEPESEPELAEVTEVESPSSFDFDGDGHPETITFTCGDTVELRVGDAQLQTAVKVWEPMGCYAYVAELGAEPANRVLVVEVQEHDEIGPGPVLIHRLGPEGLELLWQGNERVEFLTDGSFTSETSTCFETRGYEATWETTHRLDGAGVSSTTVEHRTDVDPTHCIEP